MRISDWSSDVCSSDLQEQSASRFILSTRRIRKLAEGSFHFTPSLISRWNEPSLQHRTSKPARKGSQDSPSRSEEHTSELQSLMRTSYAVFCLKKKNIINNNNPKLNNTQDNSIHQLNQQYRLAKV